MGLLHWEIPRGPNNPYGKFMVIQLSFKFGGC